VTEQEHEQARRETVAAVDVHERQVVAAQRRVDGAQAKIEKFKALLDNLKADLRAAKEELAIEQEALSKVRKQSDGVLIDGPVTLSGKTVESLADTATGVGSGN
jgi:outer membrane protein TolC